MKFIKEIKSKIKSKLKSKQSLSTLFIRIEANVRVTSKTKIGRYTFIGQFTNIGDNCLSIGSYCSIGQNVLIGPNVHPTDLLSTSAVFYSASWGVVDRELKSTFNVKHTEVGHDVWIGSYSVILPGVEIGTGAVVGANSVVTKNVPPYAIVVGNPARIVRYRFDESTIADLLERRWWERKPEEILVEYESFKQR